MQLLYSQSTQRIIDPATVKLGATTDAEIDGLDPDFIALEKVESSPPIFDPLTQSLSESWVIDVQSRTYTQQWEIQDIPPSPDYEGLIAEIRDGTAYPLTQAWYDNLPPRKRDPLQSAIAVQDASLIQSRLTPILPTDEATLNEILALLTAFNIPISLQ